MCLCFLWCFPNDSALKFDVVSIYLSWGLWGVGDLGGHWGFFLIVGYVE